MVKLLHSDLGDFRMSDAEWIEWEQSQRSGCRECGNSGAVNCHSALSAHGAWKEREDYEPGCQ